MPVQFGELLLCHAIQYRCLVNILVAIFLTQVIDELIIATEYRLPILAFISGDFAEGIGGGFHHPDIAGNR